MTDLDTIVATFTVAGGNAQDIELDTYTLTPDQVADLLVDTADGISLCHQCAQDIADPEIQELTGFTWRGVEYERRDGHWVPYAPK